MRLEPGIEEDFDRYFSAKKIDALGVAGEGQRVCDERRETEFSLDDETQRGLRGGAVVLAVAHEQQAGAEEMAGGEAHFVAEHAEEGHTALRAIHEEFDRGGHAR